MLLRQRSCRGCACRAIFGRSGFVAKWTARLVLATWWLDPHNNEAVESDDRAGGTIDVLNTESEPFRDFESVVGVYRSERRES